MNTCASNSWAVVAIGILAFVLGVLTVLAIQWVMRTRRNVHNFLADKRGRLRRRLMFAGVGVIVVLLVIDLLVH